MTDAQGRPIVAELGRPETPQETAERKAAASRAHRTNQTTFNLVIALAASLAIAIVLVVVVVRPDQQSMIKPVDWRSVGAQAQQASSEHLLMPELGSGWTSNRAEYDPAPADDVPSWSVGFITPKQQYIDFTQGVHGTDGWVVDQLDQNVATGALRIDGVTWTVYDHRQDQDPGNLAYALVATIDHSDVVLAGTASTAEFRELAAAVERDAR